MAGPADGHATPHTDDSADGIESKELQDSCCESLIPTMLSSSAGYLGPKFYLEIKIHRVSKTLLKFPRISQSRSTGGSKTEG